MGSVVIDMLLNDGSNGSHLKELYFIVYFSKIFGIKFLPLAKIIS